MTSPTCALSGHFFGDVEGVGRFAGRTFSICAQCGDFEHEADHYEHRKAAYEEMSKLMEGRWRVGTEV